MSTPLPPSSPPPGGLSVGGAEYPSAPPEQWPAFAPVPPPPDPGDPWAAPPPDPQPSGKGPALVVIGVVLALVLLVVAGVVFTRDDPDDELASDPTSTTIDLDDPAPSSPSTLPEMPTMPTMPTIPDLGPDGDPEALARPLEEVLPELIAFVETTRGHTFVTPPAVQALPDDEFVTALEATVDDEDVADLRRQSVGDQALGLIEPGTDLVEVAEDVRGAGVVGFYEPETGELRVRGDSVTPYVQTVLVHELTHALDDQIFDLDRLEALDDLPDESAFGFTALVEGTARWVEDAFREQLGPEEAAAAETEELQLGMEQGPQLLDAPLSFLIETQVPYGAGLRLVQIITDEGGTAALDAAFTDPPTTSEQVFVRSAFAERQPATEVPIPEADGPAVDQGAFGSFDLYLLGAAADPMSVAPDLGAGTIDPPGSFGGGSYVTWGSADQACIRVALAGDDAGGTRVIEEIAATWRDAFGGAQVDTVPAPGGTTLTTLFRCA